MSSTTLNKCNKYNFRIVCKKSLHIFKPYEINGAKAYVWYMNIFEVETTLSISSVASFKIIAI